MPHSSRRRVATATVAALLAGTLTAWATAPGGPDPSTALAASVTTVAAPSPSTTPAPAPSPSPVSASTTPTAAPADPHSARATATFKGAVPTRLAISPIGASLSVSAVGVAPSGAMAVPKDPRRAGWYRYSAGVDAPRGATVLAAHVDSREFGTGPLATLRSLKKGDRITVWSPKGAQVYVVRKVLLLDKDELDLKALFDRSGPHRLHVVTCGGPFDARTGHYQDNVVVTAYPTDRP